MPAMANMEDIIVDEIDTGGIPDSTTKPEKSEPSKAKFEESKTGAPKFPTQPVPHAKRPRPAA